jgi:hypothetical protein
MSQTFEEEVMVEEEAKGQQGEPREVESDT